MDTNNSHTALINRAKDTVTEWCKQNWHRALGTPDEILDTLLHYDSMFAEKWEEWCDEHGWSDGEEVDTSHPDFIALLDAIKETQDLMADEPLIKRIGREIRDARNAQDLSIREFAAKTGINISTLSQIENGTSDARTSTLARIAKALGGDLSINAPMTLDQAILKGDGFVVHLRHTRGVNEDPKVILKNFDDDAVMLLIGNPQDLYYPLSGIAFAKIHDAVSCPGIIALIAEYDKALEEMTYFAIVRQDRLAE